VRKPVFCRNYGTRNTCRNAIGCNDNGDSRHTATESYEKLRRAISSKKYRQIAISCLYEQLSEKSINSKSGGNSSGDSETRGC
jgi:hypothetical protein